MPNSIMCEVKKLTIYIKLVNLLFSRFILFLFYLAILPIGKIIYLINSFFTRKSKETYWQKTDNKQIEFESPY